MADHRPFEEIEAEKFSLLNLYWKQGREGLEDRLRYMTGEEMFFQFILNSIPRKKYGLFEAVRSSDFVPDEVIEATPSGGSEKEHVKTLF